MEDWLHQLIFWVEREGEGYTATCLDLNITREGKTSEEAQSNLKKAMKLYFATTPSEEIIKQLSRDYTIIPITVIQQGNHFAVDDRSLMELHGLGKEIWQGIDAQEYVDELRQEWDHRL